MLFAPFAKHQNNRDPQKSDSPKVAVGKVCSMPKWRGLLITFTV